MRKSADEKLMMFINMYEGFTNYTLGDVIQIVKGLKRIRPNFIEVFSKRINPEDHET